MAAADLSNLHRFSYLQPVHMLRMFSCSLCLRAASDFPGHPVIPRLFHIGDIRSAPKQITFLNLCLFQDAVVLPCCFFSMMPDLRVVLSFL